MALAAVSARLRPRLGAVRANSFASPVASRCSMPAAPSARRYCKTMAAEDEGSDAASSAEIVDDSDLPPWRRAKPWRWDPKEQEEEDEEGKD